VGNRVSTKLKNLGLVHDKDSLEQFNSLNQRVSPPAQDNLSDEVLNYIVEKDYQDKKEFDRDIQKTLKDCYVCEFVPIDWNQVEKEIRRDNISYHFSPRKSKLHGSPGTQGDQKELHLR